VVADSASARVAPSVAGSQFGIATRQAEKSEMARSTAARTAVSTLACGSEVVGGDVDAVVVDVDVGVSTATDVVVVGTVDSGAALSPELHAARSRAPLTTTPTQRPATTPTATPEYGMRLPNQWNSDRNRSYILSRAPQSGS
jgi:hypothetical protein